MKKSLGALALMQIGVMLVAPLVICLLAGLWLDTRFGTTPLLLLLGIVVGVAAGGLSVYRLIGRVNEEVGVSDQ
ncbi:MAG: AtpZ/AtpI family protein [Chloroflexi bacterium]|nr:AtpZ/AtpI family protein [Chloroflexota bacterium]